jgi:pyruvate formate lyase activating enzyme
MIFDIQRYSTHDGSGIRTTIFFKGCPLRCAWCENPESQSYEYELLYDPKKCILCLECTKIGQDGQVTLREGRIQIERAKITDPEAYREVCPANALRVVGKKQRIEEVVEEITKDLPFYQKSGGGVTLSGGEPYGQAQLLLELLRSLKKFRIKTAVETCLQAKWEHIEPSLEYVDTFLADLKHTDPDKFKAFTGGTLPVILDNFKSLERSRSEVVARIPVIPCFNDSTEEIRSIIEFTASRSNIKEIHFLPFHVLGVHKYDLIDREYAFLRKVPGWEERLEEYVHLAQARGLTANIGG